MISCLLFVLGVGRALAGVSIQMPYLHPAGVTYAGYSAALPAVAGHVHYSDATTSSVAYGNGAFLGRAYSPALSYAAAPVAHVAAPVAHVAAPVAHVAAPVAHYTSSVVPTVHHVPAVAQVPITKYEAQPAVIQNLVDVAKAKVASRKIEIRRPAIEKQFYDVEERVIIRPAGSAVVELDQPVSKAQKGPTVVQPALHSATPFLGLHAYPSQHHYIPTAAYPSPVSVHYPTHGEAASIPEPSTPAPQEFESQPEQLPQQPQAPFQQELDQFPQQNVQADAPQQQFPQLPQQEPEQFDDSDSVAVDNPDIARARSQQPEPQPQIDASRRPATQPDFQSFSARQQELIAQFQTMGQLRNTAFRQQGIARSQVEAQEQVVAQLQSQTQAQQAQLQRSQEILAIQQQELARSRQAADSFERPPQPQSPPQSRAAFTAQPQPAQNEGAPSAEPEARTSSDSAVFQQLEAGNFRSSLIGSFPRSSSPDTIPSLRLSPEESLSNQERLISLLTGQGGVVEARSNGQPIDAHQVRARVLSVTPAPEGAAPREEKVNTRRVVVSRPIQTVEEVNVDEPFTKIERVAVHSPAVIKTARVGVAHVPASLPVHGYAHAISSTPYPSYY